MSTGWQEKRGVPRCDARDPEGHQCVLASGHAGDHEPEPESFIAVDAQQGGAVSIDPTIAPAIKKSKSVYELDVPHDGGVHLDIDIEAAEEPEELDKRGRRRGCFGQAALLVAVVVAFALTQRRQ